MRDIISDETFKKTINNIGNPQEPARSEELLDVIERWQSDPLITLNHEQKLLIESTLKKYRK